MATKKEKRFLKNLGVNAMLLSNYSDQFESIVDKGDKRELMAFKKVVDGQIQSTIGVLVSQFNISLEDISDELTKFIASQVENEIINKLENEKS